MRSLSLNLSLLCFLISLSACGGSKESFEEVEYLLAKGGGDNGLSAAGRLEGLLDSGSSFNRLRAHRYYGGALINAAGLDGARFIANLAHGLANNNTVSLFRSALSGVVPVFNGETRVEDPTLEQQGLAAEEYLIKGINALTSFRQEAIYSAINTGSSDYCSKNADLCREKESVEIVLANLHFMRALNFAVRLSSLGTTGSLSEADCLAFFTEQEDRSDSFALSLRLARQSYALAGLDDSVEPGADGKTDAQDARPSQFIDDVQDSVDPNRDGDIVGTTSEKAQVICDYLVGQGD
jgi:hypothetical protein